MPSLKNACKWPDLCRICVIEPRYALQSMNTVMDDNRMLTLASNERIPLTPSMRLLLEINHMNHCSPATVSRGGVIYVNATDIGWQPVSAQLSSLHALYSKDTTESNVPIDLRTQQHDYETQMDTLPFCAQSICSYLVNSAGKLRELLQEGTEHICSTMAIRC